MAIANVIIDCWAYIVMVSTEPNIFSHKLIHLFNLVAFFFLLSNELRTMSIHAIASMRPLTISCYCLPNDSDCSYRFDILSFYWNVARLWLEYFLLHFFTFISPFIRSFFNYNRIEVKDSFALSLFILFRLLSLSFLNS